MRPVGDLTPRPRRPRVAVVVPVYRNAATLRTLATRLGAAMSAAGDTVWTLHLVVDACPDGSAVEAARLAADDPRVHATVLSVNVGQHRAIVRGLADAADADAWVCLDGDLQDPPEVVPMLVAELANRGVAGVFAGRRGVYQSAGRRLTGNAHRRVLSSISHLPPDAGAFLAMDRDLRDAVVTGVRDRGAPSVVVAAGFSGLPLASVPVRRDVRTVGESAWTSSARARQSVQTLLWAAGQRANERTRG